MLAIENKPKPTPPKKQDMQLLTSKKFIISV